MDIRNVFGIYLESFSILGQSVWD